MKYFEPLTSLLIYIFSSLGLGLGILILVYSFQTSRPNSEKNMAYECGFKQFDFTYYPFDVQFYRVGILFLLLDVEIMFFFSWILNFYQINFYGHAAIFSFIMLLLVGFIYELKSGALAWYPQPWSNWMKPMTMRFRKYISAVLSNKFQQHQFHLIKPSQWLFLLVYLLYLCLIFAVLWLHEYNISIREVFNFLTSLQVAQFMMYSVGVGGTFYIFHSLGKQHQEKWKWVPKFLPTRDLRIFWQSGKYTNSLYYPYWGIASLMWLQWVVWNTGFFVYHQNMSTFIYTLFIGYIIHLIIFIWQNRIELRIRYTSDDESFNAYCRYGLSFFGPYTLGAPWILSVQFFLSPEIGVFTIAQEYPQFKQQDAFRMEHKAYSQSSQIGYLDHVRMKILNKDSVKWPSYNIGGKWRAHQSFVHNNHLNPPISLLDFNIDHKKVQNLPTAQRGIQPAVQRPAAQPVWSNRPNAFVDMVNAQQKAKAIQESIPVDFYADSLYPTYVGNDLTKETLLEKWNNYDVFLQEKVKALAEPDGAITLGWTSEHAWAAWGRCIGEHTRISLKYIDTFNHNKAYFTPKQREEIHALIKLHGTLSYKLDSYWLQYGHSQTPPWKEGTGYAEHSLRRQGHLPG